jgi:hypothetical protein
MVSINQLDLAPVELILSFLSDITPFGRDLSDS